MRREGVRPARRWRSRLRAPGNGRTLRRSLAIRLAAVLACAAPLCAVAATLTEHLDIACLQEQPEQLRCDYRLREGGALGSVVAEFDGVVLEGHITEPYPGAEDTTTILILVDTSDPARQPVIERIVSHLEELLSHAGAHHRFGLASFDTDLYLLAEPGTDVAALRRAAGTLKAKGKTTELYRNVREAVRLISRRPDAGRRALLVMSDGLAEDFAYHHEDVIRLAREHGVMIHSVGYPRSVAQSVALQTLRRLSDESGGLYVQADHVDFSIPSGMFERMLAATDSGATLSFDLTPLFGRGAGGAVDLSLAFQTADENFIVLAPVHLPGPAAPDPGAMQAELAAQIAAGTRSEPLPPTPRGAAAEPAARSLWPWFVALAVLIVVTLVTVLLALRRVRRSITAAAADADKPGTALAWLITLDSQQTRHPIDKTPWRIGRGRNNDLTINDHSVSRLHAEVRMNDEGQLLLKDLESLNGVFVNDNRIDSIQLREADRVDIGDVRMQFTLHDEDYAAEDPTVMVRTHTPV